MSKRKQFVIPAPAGTKAISVIEGQLIVCELVVGFLVEPYKFGTSDDPRVDANVGHITASGISNLGASNQCKGIIFADGTVEILGGVFDDLKSAQGYFDENTHGEDA